MNATLTRPAQDPPSDEGKIAIQCSLLSRRGGGLPSAILPVAQRLQIPRLLVTNDAPDTQQSPEVLTLSPLQGAFRGGCILQSRRVRLVHTHGLWSGLSLAALNWRRRTDGPTLVSPHGMLDQWALNHGGGKRLKKTAAMSLVERHHLNGSAVVHALNAAEHSAIRAAGITAPIAIIPNGIDIPSKQRLEAPAWMDRPTVLFLGRLHHKKGIVELIDAWAQAHADLPGWQLALAGWDDGPNDFRERAARTGAPIVFPGALYGQDKAAAYAHCTAFVLPSYSEGLPMTVLEAWAYGKPVLMTDACNLPEGFTSGAAVRITTEPRALARTMIHSLRSPAFMNTAGAAGQALVAGQFSWEAVTARFAALYRFVLGEGDGPADLQPFEGRNNVT